MKDLLTFVVAGLAGGSSYALLALGIVLVNKSSRILNFAQGEIGAVATFVTASLAIGHGWPWPAAIAVGIVVGATVSLVTSLVLLQHSGAGRLPPLVGTVALLALLTIVEARFLGGNRVFPSPIHGKGIELAGVVVTPTRLLVMGSVALTCIVLLVLVERTRVGLALRASADNRDAATVIGLNARGVQSIAWIIAGVLGTLAGLFMGWTNETITPGFLTAALPRAFTAAILGGMTSLPGAVAGGLAIGVAESLTRWKWGQTPGSPELVVFVILFLTLLLRPQGLFGRRSRGLSTEATESLVNLRGMVRVPALRRPPAVAGWARRLLPVAGVVAVAAISAGAAEEPTAYRLAYVPILGLLALSLNSLTAATGQLSLGHIALYGLGAFMCGIAVTTWGLPSPIALVISMLVTGAVSFLLGLVALRIRGLYLAVLTLSFAVLLQEFVFPRQAFSRGGAGLQVARPVWFGIDFTNEKSFLVLCIVALAVVWAADRWILGSPLGRAMMAVRQNETAAAARGIHAPSVKVMSFVLSGIGAGLAGSLYAWRQGIVAATSFPISASFSLILYVVLGGIGSRAGVIAIAGLFAWTSTATGNNDLTEWLTIAGSGLVVLSIGRHPEGLAGIGRDLMAVVRRRQARTAALAVESPVVHPIPQARPSVAWSPLVVRLGDGRRIEPVLLAARELTVRFGHVDALRDVSIDVAPGQIVGVIGPNGAGKTTLFNCLSGFVTLRRGSVWFAGREITDRSPASRADAGLGRTFQQGGLALAESTLANLLVAQHPTIEPAWPPSALALGYRQSAAERRRRAVADEVLDLLGLGAMATDPAAALSYGNRKLLELGCALASRPRVLLLDEPAAGLADDEVAWLGRVIEGIRSQLGVAVLVIEHHVPLVKSVADTVYVLNFGQLLTAGEPDIVTQDPAVVEAYLGHRGLAGHRGGHTPTPSEAK